MKVGVITFPGSNCDEDMRHVMRDVIGHVVVALWHKDHDLQGVDLVVVPGGFSYGDYLRSGAIARFSPIMNEVVEHAQRGGLTLGICNGFQILCEAGLLPGTLLHNDSHRFICKNVFLKGQSQSAPISGPLVDEVLKIPIAHGEGKYFDHADGIKALNDNDQVIFRYCDKEGNITPEANPNGSMENIAGVCNAGKNVFGMMPHPERASEPIVGNTDGLKILEALSVLESA
ncbi:MAG: phosphoribosylformylglycinamidine synthase subunit PurQ [Flavobacteriales bacterium]|nr:phosphoribosylformylglycinamidine synthase subunit PurQ [Flavobacteriales bacterium]